MDRADNDVHTAGRWNVRGHRHRPRTGRGCHARATFVTFDGATADTVRVHFDSTFTTADGTFSTVDEGVNTLENCSAGDTGQTVGTSTIVGGTGRYAGATGTLDWTGSFSSLITSDDCYFLTFNNVISLDGEIVLAPSNGTVRLGA